MLDPATGQTHTAGGSGNGYRAVGSDLYFAKDRRESFNVGREPLEPGERPPYANRWPDQVGTAHFRVFCGPSSAVVCLICCAPIEPMRDRQNGLPLGWREAVDAHTGNMLQVTAAGGRAQVVNSAFSPIQHSLNTRIGTGSNM